MTTFLMWAGFSVSGAYVLWIMFLAVMNLQRARDSGRLGPIAYKLGVPVLVAGYALDFAVNVTVCSVVFLEPPRETTVTARLKRHVMRIGWRADLAEWIAAHLLDPFDPSGRHV